MYFRTRLALCLLLAALTAVVFGKSGRSLNCERKADQVDCQIQQYHFSGLQREIIPINQVESATVSTARAESSASGQSQPETNRPSWLTYNIYLTAEGQSRYVTSFEMPEGVKPPQLEIVRQINGLLRAEQPALHLTLEENNPGVVIAVLIFGFSLIGKNGKGLVFGWK